MFKKRLEKFVVNKVMDTMDSALNITETIQAHPLAEKIGKYVKEKTAKKENESQESCSQEHKYVRLADINIGEETEQVQDQGHLFTSKKNESQESCTQEYTYVRLTDINIDEETEQLQAQGHLFSSQMPDVPPMPGIGGLPPMPGAVPQVSYMVGVNGQQIGPCDWNQLQQMVQQGQLTQKTFVWKQGMANWEFASKIPELQPLFMNPVPPMPSIPPTPNIV